MEIPAPLGKGAVRPTVLQTVDELGLTVSRSPVSRAWRASERERQTPGGLIRVLGWSRYHLLALALSVLLKNWKETKEYKNSSTPSQARRLSSSCPGARRHQDMPGGAWLEQDYGQSWATLRCAASCTSSSPTPCKDSAESLDAQPGIVRGNNFFLV